MNLNSLKAAFGQKWYWVLGRDNDEVTLLGPYSSDDAATTIGIERGLVDFTVIPLPTRNDARATRMIKAGRFEGGDSLREALSRVKHKP